MPRAGRSFEEGRTYHVYNRVGGGGLDFSDEHLAERFVDVFRRTIRRDDVVVLGWCLLGSHDLVGLVGIERYGVKVTELADVLGKSRDGVSRWFRRGAARRETEPDFAAAADDLDRAATEDP